MKSFTVVKTDKNILWYILRSILYSICTTALFGYIPKKGETVRWENFAFEIARLDRYRIDKIICTVEDKKQDNDGEEKD